MPSDTQRGPSAVLAGFEFADLGLQPDLLSVGTLDVQPEVAEVGTP